MFGGKLFSSDKPKKPASKFKKVTDAIAMVVVIVLVVLIGWFVYCRMTGQVPFLFGRASIKILSPSMEPTVMTGDYISIEKVKPSQIEVGDVITFVSDDPALTGNMNTHRVKAITVDPVTNEYLFTTQGDNEKTNPTVDAYPARASKLVGRYVGPSPVFTFFGRLLSNPFGYFVLILVPGLILLGISSITMSRATKKMKAEHDALEASIMEARIAEEVAKLKAADEARRAAEQSSDASETINEEGKEDGNG